MVTLAQVRSQSGKEDTSTDYEQELQNTLQSFERAVEDVSEGAK